MEHRSPGKERHGARRKGKACSSPVLAMKYFIHMLYFLNFFPLISNLKGR